MGLAYERGTLAEDIKEEQKKLSKADLVIFQFPINWASVPTILKGYFDRVLIYKFSYEYGVWFNNGKFKVNHYNIISIDLFHSFISNQQLIQLILNLNRNSKFLMLRIRISMHQNCWASLRLDVPKWWCPLWILFTFEFVEHFVGCVIKCNNNKNLLLPSTQPT